MRVAVWLVVDNSGSVTFRALLDSSDSRWLRNTLWECNGGHWRLNLTRLPRLPRWLARTASRQDRGRSHGLRTALVDAVAPVIVLVLCDGDNLVMMSGFSSAQKRQSEDSDSSQTGQNIAIAAVAHRGNGAKRV